MSIGDQLRIAREYSKLKQIEVACETDISNKSISNWEHNVSSPSPEDILKLAKLYNVSTDFLYGNVFYPNSPMMYPFKGGMLTPQKGVKIPVLKNIDYKTPIELITDILEYEEISYDLAQTGDFFALKITDDCMAPRMLNGDTVIIKKQDSVESGEIALVSVSNAYGAIRQVLYTQTGLILQAYNFSAFPPHSYSKMEIQNLPIQIIGKVIELRAKF